MISTPPGIICFRKTEPSTGLHGTLRLLMLDVSKVNDLSRLGVSFEQVRPAEYSGKRKWQERRAQGAAGSSSTAPKGVVGSFAWAVKDEGEFLTVGFTKYAKQPILAKLNVQASDFCLPAYLSWKGAEACPCSTQEGHEAHDSTYHRFTEQQLALRPSFEEEPYKLPMDGPAQSAPEPSGGKGAGRAAGKGGAGRGSSGRGGRF